MCFFHKFSGYLKMFLFCLLWILIFSSTGIGNQDLDKQMDPATALRPLSSALPPRQNKTPERIILNLTEHPSTSQAVTWRTESFISDPQAQITIATESSDLAVNAGTIHGISESVNLGNDHMVSHHSVIFQSLKPHTVYAYRVGDGEHWSEWNQFRTAGQTHAPFQFINFGDPQNEIKSLCSRIFRAAYQKAPNADFWHFVGDLVNHGDRDEEWAELFDAFGWIPRMKPMILLPGNHGYPDKRYVHGKDYKVLHLWRPHFTLPENGPEGLQETAYFIDYQGVRLVMLNGNEKLPEQAKWLDTILSWNTQIWIIVAIHQPIYSSGKKRRNSQLQNLFIPVFDKHSVDLVLQGHDHTYSRTYKLRNGIRVAKNEKGTVYVVSVSGPKSYSVNRLYENIMGKIEIGRQLFQVISVDNNCLKFESFNALGELYDSFNLQK